MEKELVETFEVAKKAADAAADGGGSPEEGRCVDALKRLRKMPVNMDILVKTQVGKRLRALAKHPQKKIHVVASDLLTYWKNVVIEETSKGDKKNGSSQSSPKVDVKSERLEAVKVEKVSDSGAASVNTVSRSDSIKVEKVSSDDGIKVERTTKTEAVKVEKSGVNEAEVVPVERISKKESSVHACPPKLTSAVKCNDPTRDKLREILAEAFSRVYKETSESERDEVKNILDEVDACDPIRVAVTVECAMYEKLGHSTGSHKMKYRSMMFNLKDIKNPDFRRRVLLGHVRPDQLVDLTPEDMASDVFDCFSYQNPKLVVAGEWGRIEIEREMEMKMETLVEAALQVLNEADPAVKAQLGEATAIRWLKGSQISTNSSPPPHQQPQVPDRPARLPTIKLVPSHLMPKSGRGGSLRSRQAMLHSLVHTESWAIDLAWDIIARFGIRESMPTDFFTDFVRVAQDEGRHFTLLAARLQEMGSYYGAFPAHDGLWDSALLTSHSLLARLAVEHCVHEARGLDVVPSIIARFRNGGDKHTAKLLETVVYPEEITHCAAGVKWFRYLCLRELGEHPNAALVPDSQNPKTEEHPRKQQIGTHEDDDSVGCQEPTGGGRGEHASVIRTFHATVRRYFRGPLKPPFNEEARRAAGFEPEWYEPLATKGQRSSE